MIVGTFTKTENGAFEGQVETLMFSAELRIEAIEKTADRAPAYRVYTAHGNAEVGAGWNEKSQRTGDPYISVKIDDPSFAYPMWAALTKADDGFHLRWSRPRRQTDPDSASDEETL